jgi:hypothetical protein
MKTQTFIQGQKGRLVSSISLAVLGTLILAGHGYAQNIPLSSAGSSATFNLGGTGTGPIGMNSWMVDDDPGVNQLNQQWFWYSVNGGGVQSIDQLSAATLSGVSASGFTATYQNSMLAVVVSYSLQGGGSGTGGGDLNESVNLLNLSGGNLNVNFYQYGNFNLLQNNMNVVNIGGSTGAYSFISQTTSVGGNGIEETINQPFANYAEAGSPTAVMGDVTAGNQLNGTTSYGPANVAWGLEWSSSVTPFGGNPGNVWNVLQDQNMSIQPVPEPSSIALIALGLSAVGFIRRRQAS